MQDEFAKRGYGLAAISVDERADSVELAGELGIRFALLGDAHLRVADAYGVAMTGRDIAVPAVFVVDQSRRITFRHVGESQADRPSGRRVLGAANEAALLHGKRQLR